MHALLQPRALLVAHLQHFNVSQAQAEAMVAEADRDNDKRISSQVGAGGWGRGGVAGLGV